jgi:hypothetical protein
MKVRVAVPLPLPARLNPPFRPGGFAFGALLETGIGEADTFSASTTSRGWSTRSSVSIKVMTLASALMNVSAPTHSIRHARTPYSTPVDARCDREVSRSGSARRWAGQTLARFAKSAMGRTGASGWLLRAVPGGRFFCENLTGKLPLTRPAASPCDPCSAPAATT